MILIETLAKLDEPKRIAAAVSAVLAMTCICYYAITRDFVVKLWATKAKYASVQAAYAGTENQRADFLNLQKQLEDKKKQLKEHERKCFSSEQALQFFENINTIALEYKLKPISRIISAPKKLSVDKETKPQQQFLETQSAKVTVAGNYSDIVEFVNKLTDRPQKVCITNLDIALPPGEKFNPRASFSISVLIKLLGTPSRKTNISTKNDVANATVAAGSETDAQVPVSYPTALRNPMRFGSAATTQPEAGRLIVKGILYSQDNPSAVIGNRIVHKGDKVLGATVVRINEDSVEFEMDGKRWTQKVQH